MTELQKKVLINLFDITYPMAYRYPEYVAATNCDEISQKINEPFLATFVALKELQKLGAIECSAENMYSIPARAITKYDSGKDYFESIYFKDK